MTFADLFETLTTRGVLPRAKDCKTALRLLAQALGSPSLEECQVEAACRDEALWGQALDTHFAQLQTTGRTLSAPNRRNIRSNLRTVLKVAEAHGLLAQPLRPRLLALPLRRVFEPEYVATAPYQTTYRSQIGPRRFGLPQRDWPPDVQEGWRAYRAKGRRRLRETSLKTYAAWLTCYLGYVAHVAGRTPTWEHVFDAGLLMEYVDWHGARVGRRVSAHGRHVVIMAAAMAKVLEHHNARALADLRNTLKAPAPVHVKRHHMLSLQQLEDVAEACLAAGRLPYLTQTQARAPGAKRAAKFQQGVILKFLTCVPLRKRNVREMQLGKHLYQDRDGWQLHFAGDDLKVGHRRGQVNTYDMNLTENYPELVTLLEEFLREYRPRFPNASTRPFVFLTQYGEQLKSANFGNEISQVVAMHTGQRFYPHLIRTIWATEYLDDNPGDFATVAEMLGDTLAVVMETYFDIDYKRQQAKASAWQRGSRATG